MSQPTPFFNPGDVKPAFQTRFHFGWYAHGRSALIPSIQATLEASLRDVSERLNYHLLEVEFYPSVIRALVSLRPDVAPSTVTRFIKGNLATAARKRHGVANLWSRGWFVRSVGDVTNETVREYVEGQYDIRNSPGGDITKTVVAGKSTPLDPAELKTTDHVCFEYNLHLVFVINSRKELIDFEMAQELVAYLESVCKAKSWRVWNLEVVWNHMHLFIGASPDESPESMALSILNNTEFHLGRRYGRSIGREVSGTIWQPGYYAGTVGSATTAQVKSFLTRR